MGKNKKFQREQFVRGESARRQSGDKKALLAQGKKEQKPDLRDLWPPGYERKYPFPPSDTMDNFIEKVVKEEEIPTFSECVIGYRIWRIDVYGGLRPQVKNETWIPGLNIAKCECNEHQIPQRDDRWHKAPLRSCECGLYARFKLDQIDLSSCFYGESAMCLFVVGATAHWGKIMVHQNGIRSEFACPTTLAYHPSSRPEEIVLIKQVAEKYGIVAVPFEDLENEALLHGSLLPESALPKDIEENFGWSASLAPYPVLPFTAPMAISLGSANINMVTFSNGQTATLLPNGKWKIV